MSKRCPREHGRDLTSRQAELLEAMIAFLLAHHRLPGYRELAGLMGASSVQASWDLCDALTRKGYLAKDGRHLRIGRGLDGLPFVLTRAQEGEVAE